MAEMQRARIHSISNHFFLIASTYSAVLEAEIKRKLANKQRSRVFYDYSRTNLANWFGLVSIELM